MYPESVLRDEFWLFIYDQFRDPRGNRTVRAASPHLDALESRRALVTALLEDNQAVSSGYFSGSSECRV